MWFLYELLTERRLPLEDVTQGRLSATQKASYFSTLTEDEIQALEQVIQEHLLLHSGARPG
ncbi:hypothetical protein POL68_29685 [Stigmatella sp. ncwal1]|uniref:Uncharacterized protein n=1 Tax=Stigmatella ashevillensis TaxID=2995309 RepID=A0ABT5DG89_9BACT|nr:hypothetical protein [Stigmatella ashevillena]MDC0712672.1 hypothetical protein [Stigmatella ashevillena]